MKNDNSPAAVYERFKLEWMLAHGYTLQHLVAELEKLREESPDMSLPDIFADWEFGYAVSYTHLTLPTSAYV